MTFGNRARSDTPDEMPTLTKGHYREYGNMHCSQCDKLIQKKGDDCPTSANIVDDEVWCNTCYGKLKGYPREEWDEKYKKKSQARPQKKEEDKLSPWDRLRKVLKGKEVK